MMIIKFVDHEFILLTTKFALDRRFYVTGPVSPDSNVINVMLAPPFESNTDVKANDNVSTATVDDIVLIIWN